jgi:hypothetical protein
LHDSTAELSGLFLCGSQTKAGTEADKLQIIRLQFVTRSLFDYFPSDFGKLHPQAYLQYGWCNY